GARERIGEGGAAGPLGGARLVEERPHRRRGGRREVVVDGGGGGRGRGAGSGHGAGDEQRLAAREVEREQAGRGEVLEVVELAGALLLEQEAAVPERLRAEGAARDQVQRGHAGVGRETHALAVDGGAEVERRVLV